MRRSDADRYVQAILIDALTLHARYHGAVEHLEQSTDDALPSVASGAGPLGAGHRTIIVLDEHGDPDTVATTTVEARALEPRHDPARIARSKIDLELVEAANHLALLTRTVSGWWVPGTNAGRQADEAARASLDNLACPNHRQFGVYEMRAHQRRLCGWCDDVNREYGEPPDRVLVAQRRTQGRLTSREYAEFARRVSEHTRNRPRRRKGR